MIIDRDDVHDAVGIMFTVFPIVFEVLVYVGVFVILVSFIVTLYYRWRQYVNRVNGRGCGSGNSYVVVDEDGNHIGGIISNYFRGGVIGRVGCVNLGGGFRLIESMAEEEVQKCQSCRSPCSRSGS